MCGTSAQDRCKIVACINIMLWAIWFLMILTLYILTLVYLREVAKIYEESGLNLATLIIFLTLLVFVLFLQYYLNVILYKGSKRRDYDKINRWMKISVFFLFLDMIGLMIASHYCVNSTGILIGITWRLFCIWIVNGFRIELYNEEILLALSLVPALVEIAMEESHLNV